MVVSIEMSDCFSKLVEPLVTTQRLEDVFHKLKEETSKDLKKNFAAEIKK